MSKLTFISKTNSVQIPKEALIRYRDISSWFYVFTGEFLKEDKETCDVPISFFKDYVQEFVGEAEMLYTWYPPEQFLIPNACKEKYSEFWKYYKEKRSSIILENPSSSEARKTILEYYLEQFYNNHNAILENFLEMLFCWHQEFSRCFQYREIKRNMASFKQSLSLIDIRASRIFQSRLEDAMEKNQMEECMRLLNEAIQFTKLHWQEFITDMMGYSYPNAFCFIGHSTSTTDYVDSFYSRFVSCSLFTPQLTDTYHDGFGFIMNPKDIVGASGSDMYTKNRARDKEELLSHMYCIVEPVISPELVIEQSLERIRKANSVCTTNEVIIDGFHPLGIFCFTNGGKMLCDNYRHAYQLQKSFPELQVVEIDLTDYKEDISELLEDLVMHIEIRLSGKEEIILKNFPWELFQRRYQQMKTSFYTEEMIISLYQEMKSSMQQEETGQGEKKLCLKPQDFLFQKK